MLVRYHFLHAKLFGTAQNRDSLSGGFHPLDRRIGTKLQNFSAPPHRSIRDRKSPLTRRPLIYIFQACISQACISQVCISQAYISQACISQVCISWVCISWVCISQVCIS